MTKPKHWTVRMIEDFDLKSRYRLAQVTGVNENTLKNAHDRGTPLENFKLENGLKIAAALDMDPFEMLRKYGTVVK